MSIPKKIHYCWFGHGEKSELILKCMESWRKYCPDWEIIEWNEDNIDVDFCSYSSRAYKQKRWGFVSDVLRLKILYEQGGVYLDTDCELVNNLDVLSDYAAWFGYGTDTQINTGSGFGAEKGNELVKKLMENYVMLDDCTKFTVCTEMDEQVFKKEYPEFYANKWLRKDQIVGNNILILWDIWQYTNHHYTGSWQTLIQKIFSKTKIIKRIYFGLKERLK